MKHILTMAFVLFAVASSHTQTPSSSAAIMKQPVTFKNGSLTLRGYLFKPQGDGPFPAVVWNHGSEKTPGKARQFDAVGAIFTQAGFALFAPVRRGQDDSDGAYIVDETDRVRREKGIAAANRFVVEKMSTEQLDDQLAGLAYFKRLPWVDTSHIAVAGCSYGGIQTLLAAEKGDGYRAAVAISPAALSWNGNPLLRQRLVDAVRKITIPVMLLQPAKDASLEPARVLGDEFRRLGKPFVGRIYPADGPEEEQAHCFGGARGMHVWAADVVAFLKTK